MPLSFNFGLSANLIEAENQTFLVSASGMKPTGSVTTFQTGLEWNYAQTIYLRCGYRFYHDLASYSAGSGINTRISGVDLSIDYSVSAYDEFGHVNRFGISTRF